MDAREIAKEVRAELKKEFPGYTFSITSDYSQLKIALMSAPASPFEKGGETEYNQLNHYYLDNYGKNSGCARERWMPYFTPEAIQMLKRVVKIANRKNYDNSEIMTDYVEVGYYFQLSIGKWDKPFSVK